MTEPIVGVAVGTYYATGAAAATKTPNAEAMRHLIWALKDNREPPIEAHLIAHPSHPRGPTWVDRDSAPAYLGAIASHRRARILASLELDPERTLLIPVPSSEATSRTLRSCRWPARKLAYALQGAGLGKVVIAVVQRTRRVAKTAAKEPRTIAEIAAGFEPVGVRPVGPLLLVDDVVTTGKSLLAMAQVLGRSRGVRAFVAGLTSANAVTDAYLPRRFEVEVAEDVIRMHSPAPPRR